jgi:hypothetical protein
MAATPLSGTTLAGVKMETQPLLGAAALGLARPRTLFDIPRLVSDENSVSVARSQTSVADAANQAAIQNQ